jgi:FkbM family methyltransferase
MSSTTSPTVLRPWGAVNGTCPRCELPLLDARLLLPGWRLFVRGRCDGCGHRYVQDLPTGHALVYPSTLDLDTGETLGVQGESWFSSWLKRTWTAPSDQAVDLRVEGPGVTDAAVLLNCLDPIYGHSLLRLLNAQRHLDDGARQLVVLVPRALRHLVPPEAAEVWTLEGPPSLTWQWLLRLDERLHAELDRLDDCVLSPAFPHPHPSTWDLDRFTGPIAAQRRGSPTFVFAFRDDRRWGLTLRHQEHHLDGLWSQLRRRFPDAAAAMIGVGAPGRAPSGVADLRVQRPGISDERAWMAAAAGADLVIGIHGSHLLLPSGLARLTLELTPTERYTNALQATLVREDDPLRALWRYRQLLGGAHLADLSGRRVAHVAATMIEEADRFAALMTGPLAGIPGPAPHDMPDGGPPPTVSVPRRLAQRVGPKARGAADRVLDIVDRRRASWGAPDPPVVLTDRRGLRFELVNAEEVENFRRHGGHFEAAELDFIAEHPISGVAIDVGANIGVFSVVLARSVGPDGHVHAFEPLPVTRDRLRRTLALNDLANVTIHPVAMSDVTGVAELALYGAGFESWSSLTRQEIDLSTHLMQPERRIEVPTGTLDEFCATEDIEHVGLLKVDVEGAEGRVLRGASALLAAHRIALLFVELSDNTLETDGWSSRQVIDLLDGHGYDTWTIVDGELRPFRAAGRIAFANIVATPRAA